MEKGCLMAQQQDPNADPARGATGQQGIVAGSQDTYRSPGFKSPTVTPPANSLSGITAAPTPTTWGKYSGALTPGIQAAMGAGGSGQPGQPNADRPILEGLGKMALLGPIGLGINTKPNNSPLQDIGGALYQGLPISDASWAAAGYGPGGATLATPTAGSAPASFMGTLQTGLRSITQAPPPNTIPINAALKY